MLKTENTIVDIKYQQTGTATAVNPLGMREMQALAYEHRSKRFLLIKAPPASGKSRALMFIALDKLTNQGIKRVVVAAVPSKKYGEAVGAFIILEEGAKMTAEDVQLFCRGKIARYKIPKYVFFIDQFPLTGSGKIQKFKLKEMSLKLCEEQGIEVV